MDEARLSAEAIGCSYWELMLINSILTIGKEGKIAKLSLAAKAIDSSLKSHGMMV